VPIFILGGGSNSLIPDKGFPGLVIRLKFLNVQFRKSSKHTLVTSGAGESWDKLVGLSIRRGLSGVENLSLIPGTVGGAVYQNIGAYGAELKDILKSVEVFDTRTGRIRRLSNTACRFGYRDSIFKHPAGRQYVILSATLQLSKKFKPSIEYPDLASHFAGRVPTPFSVRRAVVAIRKRKLVYPTDTMGSAGSFFQNPVISSSSWELLSSNFPHLKGRPHGKGMTKLSAGQLIELAGLKGYKKGQVGVSDKHALVLVNYGGGTAGQVRALAKLVMESVQKKFGVVLKPEVEMV
jgi:UDP-N-acetylmuramate dehydrogenase